MRQSIFLILFISISNIICAQNKDVLDSLFGVIQSDVTPEEKVDTYVEIALEYSGLDTINSNRFLLKAAKIADSVGYDNGKADVLFVKGRNAMMRGDYDVSERYILHLLDYADQIQYAKGLADGHYAMGWIEYYRAHYDVSISTHQKALELRREIGDKESISNSLRAIGIAYKIKGDFDEALYHLSQSFALAQNVSDLAGMAESLNHIAIINSLRGNSAVAMDFYFRALKIQEKIGDKSGLAYTYQNIGLVYDQQKDYEQALEYYHYSLNLRQEIGEKRGVAQVIGYIGVIYHELLNYEKALEYHEEALELKENLGDLKGVADSYLNIGKVYMDQGQFGEAIDFQLKSLTISKEINSAWGESNALISLGKSYNELSEYETAKSYLTQGIKIARKSGLKKNVAEAAKILGITEMELGNFKDAYNAQVLRQQILDSLHSEEITKKITLLEAEYSFQKEKDSIQFENEKEKLLLDQEISSQNSTLLITTIAVGVLIIAILILIRYYRLKSVSNRKLFSLNEEINQRNRLLKHLNEEKNNLIGIVAHDLQNPLAGIMSAVDLMDKEDLSKEDHLKLKDIIKHTSSRMHKMITEILDVEAIEKSAEGIIVTSHDFSQTVRAVCEQFSHTASEKRIEIITSIEGNINVLADTRYVVQLVENLLSNAVKFSPAGKKVEVKLVERRDKAVLEVKDEGPGLSEEDKKRLFKKFQRLSAKPTGNENTTGLGLAAVKMFVERMGGTVWCESEFGKGASFFIELRLSTTSTNT